MGSSLPTDLKPFVSICLPNLNTRRFLPARMASIMGQTLTDWELIICDSYSDDGAWEYFQKLKSDPRVRLHQVPREGIYAGWNECLKRAEGEYLYIATSDDTMKPDLLAKLTRTLDRHPEVHLAICGFDRIDENGLVIGHGESDIDRLLGEYRNRSHRRPGVAEFLVELCLGCDWETITASLCRRTLFNKTGLFRTDLGSIADVPWRLTATLYTDLIYVPDKLATWRVYSAQPTSNLPADWTRIQRDCFADVIDRHVDRIPQEWRKDPRWRDKLIRHAERLYLKSYRLDRMSLRRAPLAFLGGSWRASWHEPGYLARRLLTGLSWETDADDDLAHFRRLVDEWHVPWPPVSA